MTQKKTHYDDLQVKGDASLEVIKDAYEHLTQKYHPDKAPDGEAERYKREMEIIARAYHVLSDPDRRAEYDASLVAERAASQRNESEQGAANSEQGTTEDAGYSNRHNNDRSSTDSQHPEGAKYPIRKYYEAAIGPNNTDYYLKRFEGYDRFEASSLSWNWNWGAFLWPMGWLLYRKMWGMAGLCFLINPIIPTLALPSVLFLPFILFVFLIQLILSPTLAASPEFLPSILILSFILVPPFILAANANSLYYKHVRKIIEKKGKRISEDEEEQLAWISSHAGVSAVVKGILILVLLIMVAIYALYAFASLIL